MLSISSLLKHFTPVLAQDCLLCAARADAQPLCTACADTLPYHDAPACPQCALLTSDGSVCGECLSHPPAFDGTIAAFDYSFPLDTLVHQLKYHHNLALVEVVAQSLCRKLMKGEKPDMVLALPLHKTRLQERGFNQSAEIAKSLTREWKVLLQLKGYQRIRDTKEQATLKWKERRANVRGAFACELDLRGQHVAVVDDVMTTGATLNEFAKTLKQAGAEKISVYVVARTLKREK